MPKSCHWLLSIVFVLLFTSSAAALNQGDWNIGFWTGGGAALSEKGNDTNLWLTGIRAGKVLTKERGSGLFRGNLEYGVEFIPIFLVIQDSTVYGFDFTPLLLKWNFSTDKSALPYFEFGAGMLVSSDDVPEKTSTFNFTPQAGFGLHVLTRNNQAVTFTVKYMHISNGGLRSPNPGLNSIQFFVGYNWFH